VHPFILCKHKLLFWMRLIAINHLTALLQSSVSHDPSEIILIYWFDAQKTLSCVDYYVCRNHDSFYFSRILWRTGISLKQKSFVTLKHRHHAIKILNIYILPLLINLIYPWWKKELIAVNKIKLNDPNIFNSSIV